MSTLHLLFPGAKYSIAAYCSDNGVSDVLTFLKDRKTLVATDEAAFKALFAWHGNHGQIRNKEKCNFLEDGIFEYKAPGGGRIAWFYDEGYLVVCAACVVKKKQKADPGFIAKATAVRDQYKREKQNGQVHRLF